METHSLAGGFADPALDAAKAFRGIMDVMARPGTIHKVAGAEPPAPLSIAAATLILTLCDPDTPIYLAGDLDCPAIHNWIAFHTGAPVTGPAKAMFAVGTWAALQPLNAYPIGTSEYPDRSTTLIVETDALSNSGTTLRGPGIKATAQLSLPETAAFQQNARHFPLGCDFYFTCGDRLAALPRSTEVR